MNVHRSPVRFVIIGGVAAGAAAAARARRLSESAEITVLERGVDVSFANCGLPYHIAGEIADRAKLAVQTPQSLRSMLNLVVRTRTEAVAVNRAAKTVRIRELDTGHESDLPYDKLLIATGAAPVRPGLPGAGDPRVAVLRNLQDMDRIKAAAASASDILVVGAGFIGLELAEGFRHMGKTVTLVELLPQVLPPLDEEMAAPVAAALRRGGVRVRLAESVVRFETEGRLRAVLSSGDSVEADLVVLSVGIRPESSLAESCGLALGERGGIRVNAWQQTSDPDIYAAGDAVETADRVLGSRCLVPLGGPANRQGRVAADHIFLGERAHAYPGSLGTAIVRVFDVAAAATGWSEKRLAKAGVPHRATTVVAHQHAGYFPGAALLTLKILWSPDDGRLLGAQCAGPDGVDKRIDVLATAISARMTVDDLCHLELAYAPPYGAARDIVNIAGFAATNQRDGLVRVLRGALPPDFQLIDVRPAAMASASPVPGALAIPLDQLRSRMSELDRDRPVAALCLMGKTAYFACRVLSQRGFEAYQIAGGITVAGTPSRGGC